MVTTCSSISKKDCMNIPDQNKQHEQWLSEEHQNIEQRVAEGRSGVVYQHDPRHVHVLVKDLGLERGNSVQTPAVPPRDI